MTRRVRIVPYVLATLLSLVLASAHAESQLSTPLKTAVMEDPYATDGLSFRVLCYHDVRDQLRDSLAAWPERSALDTYDLVEQFEWLRDNDYHVVSLDQILAARNGGPPLPPRAVLLSFDDGYVSTYTRVFPLLKLFHYPAVVALVGEWLAAPDDGQVHYGDLLLPRAQFVSWPQVREMLASGLVEIASHSYGLHRGIVGNPQASSMPAAVTRAYHAATSSYESEAQYRARITADLARNSALIEQHTGLRPRTMVWPYGAYNQLAVEAARAADMPYTFTLEAGPNTPQQALGRVRRSMLLFHDKTSDLKASLRQGAAHDGVEQPLGRIVAVDLDDIYAADAQVQERKLGTLVQRLHDLRVNTVYLRAWSDSDHDGRADALYFPNRHLPLRADLFSRIAWQIRTRVAVAPDSVYVYAWLPVSRRVLALNDEARADIYSDLASHAPLLGGLLLGDEGELGEISETADTAALLEAFRIYQPGALSARLLIGAADAQPAATGEWLADYRQQLKEYDFVTLFVDSGARSQRAFTRLLDDAARIPHALDTTAFVLRWQGRDTAPGETDDRLTTLLRAAHRHGARNFGYFPEHAEQDQPRFAALHSILSLTTNPGDAP